MRTSKFIRFDLMLIEVETYPKHYEITQCISGFGSSSPLAQSRIVVSMFMSAYGRPKDEVGESSASEACGGAFIRLNLRYLQFGCQSLSRVPKGSHILESKVGILM